MEDLHGPTSIRMPRSARPVFPPVCVSCGRDGPEKLYSVDVALGTSLATIGDLTGIPGAGLFRMSESSLPFPCCHACHWRLQGRPNLLLPVYAAWLVVGCVGLVATANALAGLWLSHPGWGIAACVAYALAPALVFAVFYRPAVVATAYETDRDLVVEFRNPDVARAFADANGV